MNSQRLPVLDIMRGLAVVWMIIFHSFYDLKLFGMPTLPESWSWFWWWFPRIIVASFLFVMGASWVIAREREAELRPFLKRFSKLAGAALLVSVGTYLLFPDRWVYFGTLHCLAFCSLILFIFDGRRPLAWAALFLIIALEISGNRPPWIDLDHLSMDYIPPFPWLGFALLGFLLSAPLRKIELPLFMLRVLKPLRWPGKHSLKIYLLHQPLIFGLLWLIHTYINKR